MEHQIHIFQDGGGTLKKIMHFVKPETYVPCKVAIKNLRTQTTFGYDKYHNVLPSGDYVMLFTDETGKQVGAKELHLDDKSGEHVWVVFMHQPSIMHCSADIVDEAACQEKMNAKRLHQPAGYAGY